MPMIEFRYKPEKISGESAAAISESLDDGLRFAINNLRNKGSDFGITVEGDPFGPITRSQPDLRIYIFYHQEWEFTPNDLDCLAAAMGVQIQHVISELQLHDVSAVIRFYARAGHASVKVG